MIADLMAAGDQSGCELLIRAATPLTCGDAMDVPDWMLKAPGPCFTFRGHAARMFSPGASMSGLSTPGEVELGPREENHATTGAGRTPSNVLLKVRPAMALLADSE
jgi:hypothetical protein